MIQKTQNHILDLDLVPLSRFNEHFEYPLVSTLRYHVFHNTYDFNKKVVRRFGKRLYIKISALRAWIEENSGENVA